MNPSISEQFRQLGGIEDFPDHVDEEVPEGIEQKLAKLEESETTESFSDKHGNTTEESRTLVDGELKTEDSDEEPEEKPVEKKAPAKKTAAKKASK